jgi:type II secretory pathway component PulM
MLNLVEKIQLVASGLILLLVLMLCLLFGRPPETRAYIPIRTIEEPPAGAQPASGGAGSENQGASPAASADPKLKEELRRLAKAHNLPLSTFAADPRRVQKVVPPEKFEVLAEKKNWLPELNRAKGYALVDSSGRPTMYEIEEVESQSLLEDIGFQNGDQLMLVDGLSLEFDPGQAQRFMEMAESVTERLGKGGTLPIHILRNGKSMLLEFKVGR